MLAVTNGEIAVAFFIFEDGKFYKDGSVFDDAAFAQLAARVRDSGGLNPAGAPGARSLRVAALVNTIVSAKDSGGRSAVLEGLRTFRAKAVRVADSNNGRVEEPLRDLC